MDIPRIPAKQKQLCNIFKEIVNSQYQEENKRLKSEIKELRKRDDLVWISGVLLIIIVMLRISSYQEQSAQLKALLEDPSPTESTVVNYITPEEVTNTPGIIWHKYKALAHPSDSIKV